jgi:hypothetical protein
MARWTGEYDGVDDDSEDSQLIDGYDPVDDGYDPYYDDANYDAWWPDYPYGPDITDPGF